MLSPSVVGLITGAFTVVVYGTLIVLGLVFGRRSGGYLAAGGLLVLLFGNVVTGALLSSAGIAGFGMGVGLVNLIGLGLVVAGIAMNAQQFRMGR